MNLISKEGKLISISLSRRNLLTLIKCLDQNVAMPILRRRVDDEGTVLVVKAEEDMEHYNSNARQPAAQSIMGVGPDDVPELRSAPVDKKEVH